MWYLNYNCQTSQRCERGDQGEGCDGEALGGRERGGGGESRGVPDSRGPGHAHGHRAAPPVELQHLRRALEAEDAGAARHGPHVFLCEAQVEAESHELTHGPALLALLAPTALVTRYVRVNMSEASHLNT